MSNSECTSGNSYSSDDITERNVVKNYSYSLIAHQKMIESFIFTEKIKSLKCQHEFRMICASAKGKDSCQGDSGGKSFVMILYSIGQLLKLPYILHNTYI